MDDMNYLINKYVVEIEVIQQSEDGNKTVYLRYVTLNTIGQSVYPKAFITILKRLTSRTAPFYLNGQHEGKDTEVMYDPNQHKINTVDHVFDCLIEQDLTLPLLMKKNPKLDKLPIGVGGLILETPTGQLELVSLNHYNRAESEWALSNKARYPSPSQTQIQQSLHMTLGDKFGFAVN